ncbi:hypothetical protein [uncultured Endozoicomonas sp.]|uniref:hypothetical protein n=1 Tax=uncultured Endozoicomonas sp. TaxID=432652 RepID=UPI002621D1BE|nr:hypothetical protein [uncultured Endozoicomonas sp.]
MMPRTFLLLFSLFFSGAVFADNDCNQSDAACDSSGNSAIKIKRLFNIDLGKWGGEQVSSGQTEAANDGRLFCLIAYTENNPRELDDFTISLTQVTPQPRSTGFTLRNASSEKSIPVTLTISAAPGDAQDGKIVGKDLSESITVEQAPDDSIYRNCKNNEYIISASVMSDDILNNATSAQYFGRFILTAQRDTTPLLTVQVPFTVSIELTPMVQISGLEDMSLSHNDGEDIQEEQKFCVYGLGTKRFKIRGESKTGSGDFRLSNGNSDILYSLSIGSGNSNGNGNLITLEEGGDYITKQSWKASSTQLCDNGANENMRLRITINNAEIKGKEAGLYKDTAYLIVAPD